MRKFIALLASILLGLSMVGCGSKNVATPFYSSAEEVTLEKLKEMSTLVQMLEYKGGVEIRYAFQNDLNANSDRREMTEKYRKKGDIIYVNQRAELSDNEVTLFYFSNDKNDPYLYIQAYGRTDQIPVEPEEVDSLLRFSILDFGDREAELVSVTEEKQKYVARVEITENGSKYADVNISIDPVSGYVSGFENISYSDGVEDGRQNIEITYSADVTIDFSPKTGSTKAEANSGMGDKLTFSTTDIDGNAVTEDLIKNAKLVMINFWEPWCGPCVGEMPDLEKLYEKYKDQGLLIIGVFSSTDMVSEAKQIMKDCNTGYPVLRCDSNLAKLMTDYVPTTVFVDSEGNILSTEPVIGAHSYDDWEKMIKDYLK